MMPAPKSETELPSGATLVSSDRAQRQRRLWRAWLPALIWLAVIAVESTALLGAHNTGRILYPIVHFLLGPMPWERFWAINRWCRKVGHVVGYATLSWFFFRGWRETITLPVQWSLRWARLAFLMAAAVATLDEVHQLFIPGREGRWQDVLIDSSAALAAQIILFAILYRKTPPDSAQSSGY